MALRTDPVTSKNRAKFIRTVSPRWPAAQLSCEAIRRHNSGGRNDEEWHFHEKEIIESIRNTTLLLKVVPVLCGTALRNKGIQPILDAIANFLPSPEDIPPVEGINPETNTIEKRRSNAKDPLAALAFKVMLDEGRKITYMRIYSGKIKAGEDIYNASKGKKEKVSRLLKMHSKIHW